MSVLLPDQHEDDACRDVQAADWARDAHLHLESRHRAGCRPNNEQKDGVDGWMERWRGMEGCDTDNLFFYHLFLSFFRCLSLQCCKEHPVLVFRFLSLSYFVMMALQCEHSVVLYTRLPGVEKK